MDISEDRDLKTNDRHKPHSPPTSPLLRLPKDLLYCVLSYVSSLPDRASVKCTCKTLFELTKHNKSFPSHLDFNDVPAHWFSHVTSELEHKSFDHLSLTCLRSVPGEGAILDVLTYVKTRKLSVCWVNDLLYQALSEMEYAESVQSLTIMSMVKRKIEGASKAYHKLTSLTELSVRNLMQQGSRSLLLSLYLRSHSLAQREFSRYRSVTQTHIYIHTHTNYTESKQARERDREKDREMKERKKERHRECREFGRHYCIHATQKSNIHTRVETKQQLSARRRTQSEFG